MRYMTQITEAMLRLLVSASRWLLKRILGYSSWDLVSAAITESGHSPSTVSCKQDSPTCPRCSTIHHPAHPASLLSPRRPVAELQRWLRTPPRTLPVPPPFLNGLSGGREPKGFTREHSLEGGKGEDSRAISPSCLLAQDPLVWSHSPIRTVQ